MKRRNQEWKEQTSIPMMDLTPWPPLNKATTRIAKKAIIINTPSTKIDINVVFSSSGSTLLTSF